MFLLFVTQITFSSAWASDPAFEGYYKFILGGKHTGYVIQRFEIDPKKKQMTSTYYIYVKTPSGSTTESLEATSDLSFEPITYRYTALVDGNGKATDGMFKNKKMTGSIIDSAMPGKNKTQKILLTVPPNGFMSTFLPYVILKNGMMVGKNYEYYALAEESPACFKNDASCDPKKVGFIKGSAAIKSEQKHKGVDSFKIEFKYKDIPFEGYLSHTGETLSSHSPLQNASTELVATKAEAVADLPFNLTHVKTLFKGLPEGKKNSLHLNAAKPDDKKGQ